MLFLTTVETTIATTSLVHIMDDLGDFEEQSWIMTSYELGYVGESAIATIPSTHVNSTLTTLRCSCHGDFCQVE